MTIDYRILKILDDCGDTSAIENWVEYLDGLNPVDNQVYVKEGSHSMALGIDADKDAGDVSYWINQQSWGDMSVYQNDWVYLWVYFPTIDYLLTPGNPFRFYIGTSAGDLIRFYWAKSDLTVGWNLLKCDLDNPDYTVGTIDWTDLDYFGIFVYGVAGNTNDFTVYVDSIMFVRPFLKGFSLFRVFKTRRR